MCFGFKIFSKSQPLTLDEYYGNVIKLLSGRGGFPTLGLETLYKSMII
jgi:hypothetical protein